MPTTMIALMVLLMAVIIIGTAAARALERQTLGNRPHRRTMSGGDDSDPILDPAFLAARGLSEDGNGGYDHPAINAHRNHGTHSSGHRHPEAPDGTDGMGLSSFSDSSDHGHSHGHSHGHCGHGHSHDSGHHGGSHHSHDGGGSFGHDSGSFGGDGGSFGGDSGGGGDCGGGGDSGGGSSD